MKYSGIFFLGILLVVVSPVITQAQERCDAQVMTAQGPVIGVDDEKSPVCVYKGIPYAAPPVGRLRFRPPQPPLKRNSVFKADHFSAECIQSGGPMPGVKAVPRSEDCLYLNIWRPKKSGTFPVMLWIHGGSLTSGSGVIPLYFGDRLAAEKDVVVVTINYRLAWLGFLAHPDLSLEDPMGSSGNYGLLDQIEALKWVRRNIAGFGGDPNNVTIFGESAGGWSVCNLLASPLAAGLFQKAVIESGGCDVVTTLERGFEVGRKFANDAGCEFRDPIPCLRSKTPEEIKRALDASSLQAKAEAREKGRENPGALSPEQAKFDWIPHIDHWVLNEKPIDALRGQRFNQVPLMVGSNKDEFKLFTIAIPGIRSIPKCIIHKELFSILGGDTASGIEKLYPYENYRKPADAVLDALGDMGLGCKCFSAAEAVAAFQPVYYYRFDFSKHNFPHMVGAAHAVEIPFIFNTLDRAPANIVASPAKRKKAEPLVRVMMSYWTNFAKTGDPNGNGLPLWPKYDPVRRERIYLDITSKVAPTDNVLKCEFWAEHDLMQQ